ncbi:hypothetical protein [Enterococcus faecalis]|uniref:hypothetical protein n=1 Tax=Enterococcus faecalis TaxID=1351 RepID=UPI001F56790F|nr:hypothetical protein [Enterococcus faecalis]
MNKIDNILEKLMNLTINKKIRWIAFTSFPTDETLPFYGHSDIVTDESYLYSYSADNYNDGDIIGQDKNSGYFFLATFKTTDLNNEQITKLKFGFKQHFGDMSILSENQEKLFELKALIEYKETKKEMTIDNILDNFLNDEC